MELIEALKKDHKKIRDVIKEARKKKATFEAKKTLFRRLVALTEAHLQAEEKVVYLAAKSNPEIRQGAYLGIEEHSLIEQLILEDQSVNNQDVWEAKFKVACDLLELHFSEEESTFFPQIKKALAVGDRKEKGSEYDELFDNLLDQAMYERPSERSRQMPERSRDIRAH